MVGYNVQVAVDTEHHLIVAHEVTNEGNDKAQLSNMAAQAKAALQVDELDAVADRGYFKSEEILSCEEAAITVTLPKPMTSGAKAKGRFGKQDFVYKADEDVYLCPAGERLTHRFTNEEDGKVMRNYWTTACQACPLKEQCTTGKERRIKRWEHEHVLARIMHGASELAPRHPLSRQVPGFEHDKARCFEAAGGRRCLRLRGRGSFGGIGAPAFR